MTLIQTQNKPMQNEQGTKHGKKGNGRDYFIILNTVQGQLQQQKRWKFLPPTSQKLSSLSSWQGFGHVTGVSIPLSDSSLLLPDESTQQKRASNDPSYSGDPDMDEYHTNLRIRSSPKNEQTSLGHNPAKVSNSARQPAFQFIS